MVNRNFLPILILISGSFTSLFGQDLTLIGSGGGMTQSQNLFLSYSIGEPFINHNLNTGHWITEGFQQPDAIDLMVSIDENGATQHLTISPNPTRESISVADVQDNSCDKIQITNMYGQVMITQTYVTAQKQTIDLSPLPSGMYILSIQCSYATRISQSIIKI